METKYTIYKPDGTTEDHYMDLKEDPGYDVLARIVRPWLDNAWLEHVSVLHDGKQKDMFVDEEGLLKGLPYNKKATEIYHTMYRTQWPTDYAAAVQAGQLSPIVGIAILFHRRVWF